MEKYKEEIQNDKKFEGSLVEEENNKIKVTAKEEYVFYVEEEKVEFGGKEEVTTKPESLASKVEVGDVAEGVEKRTLTGSGARSITVEDVNKICGATPSTELSYSNYGKEYTTSKCYPTITTESGYSTSEVSRKYKSMFYLYAGSDKLSTTSNEYKMLFKNVDTDNYLVYCLASRCVADSNMDTLNYFRVREVRRWCFRRQYRS